MKSPQEKSPSNHRFRRFISYYRAHRGLFILDMVCAFLVAGLDLLFPLITKRFLEDFIPNQTPANFRLMLLFSILLLGLYLFRTGFYYIVTYWGHVLGIRMEYDMRNDLFCHLQTMDLKYFDENKTGQIMSRLVGDLREITELAHHGPEDLFISVSMLTGAFVVMLILNPWLTIIIFSFVVVQVIFTMKKRFDLLKAFRMTRQQHADINARIENSISGIRLCKSFANEPYEWGKFAESSRSYLHSYHKAYKIMAEFASGNTFLTDILGLVAIVAGGIFVYFNYISVPVLVTFVLFSTIFVRPIRRLIDFTQMFQAGLAGFERFAEIMEIRPNIDDLPGAIDLKNPQGEIEFRNVTFRYETNGPIILKNFDLKIPAGKTVALVGPSGVGKTTITYLIPRFYDIDQGEIQIDGYNIKSLSIDSLRRAIGFVQQDVFIFFGTLRDNILYGKPGATDQEVIEAAKQADIHEFIMSLPEKYNALVGERGVKLSGGQKQRIALARLFLRNPPILILDEATSSLDNLTEITIQTAIEQLAKGRTTLVIAHRLSTIKNADEIIVLGDEGIIERGNHEKLVHANNLYTKLYRAQFRGILPEKI